LDIAAVTLSQTRLAPKDGEQRGRNAADSDLCLHKLPPYGM
jgi:hypothetical protein